MIVQALQPIDMVPWYSAMVLLHVCVQRAFPVVIRARSFSCRSLHLLRVGLTELVPHEDRERKFGKIEMQSSL